MSRIKKVAVCAMCKVEISGKRIGIIANGHIGIIDEACESAAREAGWIAPAVSAAYAGYEPMKTYRCPCGKSGRAVPSKIAETDCPACGKREWIEVAEAVS